MNLLLDTHVFLWWVNAAAAYSGELDCVSGHAGLEYARKNNQTVM